MEKQPEEKKKLPIIPIVAAAAALAIGGGAFFHFSSTAVVPEVAGMTAEEAEEVIEAASLTPVEGKSEKSDTVEKGHVIRTEETGRLDKDSQVTIIVSEGSAYQMVDFVGTDANEAASQLVAEGLDVSMETAYSSEYDEGLVVSQSQEPGASLEEGDSVVLTMSLGKEACPLFNYVGQPLDAVKKEAESSGFKVEVKKEFSDQKKNTVLSQSPEEGAEFYVGDTLTVTVSKGLEQVKVPDVTGISQSDAKQKLKDAGLQLGDVTKDYSSSVSSGNVISQKTEAGKEVDKGSSVSVTVSLGSRPVSSSSSHKKKSSSHKKKSSSHKKKKKKKSSGGGADATW